MMDPKNWNALCAAADEEEQTVSALARQAVSRKRVIMRASSSALHRPLTLGV
jgi:hypothetical protein